MDSEIVFFKILSRHSAKLLGLKRYFTGNPCPKGHVAERHSINSGCCECSSIKNVARKEYTYSQNKINYQKNRDYWLAYLKEWRKNNKDKNSLTYKAYYEANKEKIAAKNKVFREKNKEICKLRSRNWSRKNSALKASYCAARRAKKLERTPEWLTNEHLWKIVSVYKLASEQGLTVDHIIPLCGKTVSGLHVPWNLQLLTKEQNSTKSNKLIYA